MAYNHKGAFFLIVHNAKGWGEQPGSSPDPQTITRLRRAATTLVTIRDSVTKSVSEWVSELLNGLWCVGPTRGLPMADDSITPPTPQAQFFEALSDLQYRFQADETLETAIPKATALGFSLQSWQGKEGAQYALNHSGGHFVYIQPNPEACLHARDVVGALLGLPSSLGVEVKASASSVALEVEAIIAGAAHAATTQVKPAPAAPPAAASPPEPAPEPAPPASEPEEFDLGEDPLVADPDPNDDPSTSTEPLSEEEKEGLLAMLRALPQAQSKAAIVAFRKAFNIPATITRNGDAITQVRHKVFLARLIDEAEDIPSP